MVKVIRSLSGSFQEGREVQVLFLAWQSGFSGMQTQLSQYSEGKEGLGRADGIAQRVITARLASVRPRGHVTLWIACWANERP